MSVGAEELPQLERLEKDGPFSGAQGEFDGAPVLNASDSFTVVTFVQEGVFFIFPEEVVGEIKHSWIGQ